MTETSQERAAAEATSARWLALVVLLGAAFMDLADVTIVNIALPSIQRDLDTSAAGLQWVSVGYALTFAATMILGGRLGDVYGRKRIFLIGVLIFTAASAAAALAPSTVVLVVSRIVKGVGAGLMVPQVLSMINVEFSGEERSKAFGLYGATIGLATVLGQLIGAALIELDLWGSDWRLIFFVNIPVGLAALVLGVRYLHESAEGGNPSLDIPGAAGVALTMCLVLVPLTLGREEGWPAWCWLMLAASAAAISAVWAYERRLSRAGKEVLIPGKIFRRSTTGGFAVQVTFAAAAGAFFLTWILYMQIGLGWSPLRAACTGLAFAVAAAFSSWIAIQTLAARLGRGALQIGCVLMTGGALLFAALVNEDLSSGAMVLPLAIMGAGMGCVIAPLADLVLTDVPPDDSGAVSGVFNTLNQVGLAVGVAFSSVSFFDVLDEGYPAAFRSSLYWIAAMLVISLAVTMIIPRQLRPEQTNDGAGN